ncbi:hypothetical protein [Bacillus altitudinis]|uniref:hypothetical protein n=1 Tax=Bacillus altitudinis TaxID=293387 RepID=UPI003670AC27
MATVAKRLGKGMVSITPNTVMYTVPTSTTTLVKAVTICNTVSTPVTVRLSFAGAAVIFDHTIKPNDTITIPFIDQILMGGETITGSASASAVWYYISGKEVT